MCKKSDEYVLSIMEQKSFSKWYCEAKHCVRCKQRGITLALDSDSEDYMDSMLAWTDCFKYVIEIFLVACIKRKYHVLAYLIYLWDCHLLPEEDMFRVFCLHEFETEFERDMTVLLAAKFHEYPTIFCEIARILAISPLALQDSMLELVE